MLRLAREVQAILEEEARSAIDAGWAELRVEEGDLGPSLHLEPINYEAAPLEIYFDSEELVMCSPGRHGIVVEFFSEDPSKIIDRVRALVVALVSGSYTERISGNGGETVADWQGPSGPEKATRSTIGETPSRPKSWRTVNYVSY